MSAPSITFAYILLYFIMPDPLKDTALPQLLGVAHNERDLYTRELHNDANPQFTNWPPTAHKHARTYVGKHRSGSIFSAWGRNKKVRGR